MTAVSPWRGFLIASNAAPAKTMAMKRLPDGLLDKYAAQKDASSR